LELHVGADGIRKAASVEANLLQWSQVARVRQAGQERLRVLDRATERQARQVGEVVGAERRPEALLTELRELGMAVTSPASRSSM
jgi:hypothetical protein